MKIVTLFHVKLLATLIWMFYLKDRGKFFVLFHETVSLILSLRHIPITDSLEFCLLTRFPLGEHLDQRKLIELGLYHRSVNYFLIMIV